MTRKAQFRLLKVLAFVMGGGALCQTAVCSQDTAALAAGAVSGWLQSIVNVFLATYLGQVFGTSTTGF